MNTLAEKFRLKRKELRLSQQTLAEGICEQSQISKIERGHFIPSADLLFKLSQRLEVPLDYFFNEQIEIKSNLSNFKQLSARLLDDRNYVTGLEKTAFLIRKKLQLKPILKKKVSYLHLQTQMLKQIQLEIVQQLFTIV